MPVRDTDRGARALTQRVATLSRGPRVRVGITEDAGAEPHPSGGGTVAEVAAFVEFGTTSSPAQSFVRAPVDENEPRIERALAQGAERVARGTDTVHGALATVGAELAEKMRGRVPVESGATRDAIGVEVSS
jgi:hypothetical protein